MAKLVVEGKTVEIKAAETIIGRASDCAVPISEKQASRQHCKIIRGEKQWQLVDLNSRNGTLVDGRKVTDSAVLKHGTTIQIGGTRLRFECIEAPPPPSIPGYEISEVIGQGGMGFVYRGTQTSLGRPVAVKILAAHYAADPTYVERFQREARMMADLQHPNIVGVFDVGKAGETHYLIMELVEGESLQSMVDARGPLAEAEVAKIGRDVASALAFAAERQLVHRDIKPENVLVTKSGPAKLCDLGIAKRLQPEAALTAPDTVMGTAQYISPEQARGKPLDFRSDLYQLGGTLFFALTGRVPYVGESTAAIVGQHLNAPVPDPRKAAQVSDNAAAIVMKLMAKQPDQRYASASELAADLERLEQGRAPLAALGTRRPTDVKDAAKKAAQARKRSTMILLAASAMIAIGGISVLAVVGLRLWNKPEPPPPIVKPPPPPPAPVDHAKEEAEKQKKAFEEAVAAWKRDRAAVAPGKTAALLQTLGKRAKPFDGTPFEEEWKKLRDEFLSEAEAACDAVWEPIRKQIQDRADRGLLLEAQGMIDTLPQEARSVDGQNPSRAEASRRALADEVRGRWEARRQTDRSAFQSAVQAGEWMRAWELTTGLEGCWTENEIRAMRRDLIGKHREAMSRPPLTKARVAAAEQTIRSLQEKFVGDADLIQRFEAVLHRIEADRAQEISRLESAHREAYAKAAARLRALGKERRFYEMRLALLPVLLPERKPEMEPYLETLTIDLSFLNEARGVTAKADLLAKVEVVIPKFAAGSAFAEALAGLRDALLMERLCLAAADGFLKIRSEDYSGLENGILKHATELEIDRVEAKDAETAVVLSIVVHQGENKGNPLKFYLSPVKNPGTISIGDVVRMAERGGGMADVAAASGLLYFYAGDPRGRELLQKSGDKLAQRHLAK